MFDIEKSVNKKCLILMYKIKKLYRPNSGMKIAQLLHPKVIIKTTHKHTSQWSRLFIYKTNEFDLVICLLLRY